MAEEYYQPDQRWIDIGITSNELHEKHAVIKGYFHEGVPEDVVKEFTTAEYLMAHAFYYWPMYDEALSKSVFTVEVAIKMKATELNIPLTFKTKKGDVRDKRLVDLINEVCDIETYSGFRNVLHKIRELRNLKAHPKRHGFAGPYGSDRYIKHIVNTINRFFETEPYLDNYNQHIESLIQELKDLNEYVLKLEGDGAPFLLSVVHGFQPVGTDLIVSVFPMRSEYNSTDEGFDVESPKIYLFKKFKFEGNIFTGTTRDGLVITISATDKPQNIKAKEEREAYIKQLDESQRMLFHSSMDYDSNWRIVKAEYEYNSERYASK